jgi:hypothetical protein
MCSLLGSVWPGPGFILTIFYWLPTAAVFSFIKKLGLRGIMTAPLGIVLKKVFSHRPRKSPNPRPIHTQGDVTREKGRSLYLHFGMGRARGFFYPQPEIRSHGSSNSGPEGCRRNFLTSWSSILWRFFFYRSS